MDLKDYVSLRNLFEESLNEADSSFLINLILKGGKLHYIEKLMDRLEGYSSYSELVYLKNVYELLEKLGVNNVIFDFSIYSYQAYYTGIIFSIYVDGVAKSILTGGRCDKLLNDFGSDLEDCGFGLDIDSLAKYCLDNNLIEVLNKKYLALVSKDNLEVAFNINQKLRDEDIIVSEIDFESLDEAINYAKAHNFDSIITYKENDYQIMEVKKC